MKDKIKQALKDTWVDFKALETQSKIVLVIIIGGLGWLSKFAPAAYNLIKGLF